MCRGRTWRLDANRLGLHGRATFLYAPQQLFVAMQRERSVSMAGCVQVSEFLGGGVDALLQLGLDIRFIPNPARVDGDLLQAADNRIVLLVVLEQGLIGVLPERDKLLESPKQKLLHDFNVSIQSIH